MVIAAMNPFELFVHNLGGMGFFGFLFPWLFIFAVVLGLLMKTKTITDDKRIMAIISIVIAFFVAGFGGPALAGFFVSAFGMAAMVLAGILVVILFVSMAGVDVTELGKNKAVKWSLVAIGIIIFIIAIGAWTIVPDPSVLAIIFVVVIMLLMVVFIAGPSMGGGKSS
ncbi:MAG: hypothetical protein ABIA21_03975 [Candidatus Aenigmatarchaeota archaeon]